MLGNSIPTSLERGSVKYSQQPRCSSVFFRPITGVPDSGERSASTFHHRRTKISTFPISVGDIISTPTVGFLSTSPLDVEDIFSQPVLDSSPQHQSSSRPFYHDQLRSRRLGRNGKVHSRTMYIVIVFFVVFFYSVLRYKRYNINFPLLHLGYSLDTNTTTVVIPC